MGTRHYAALSPVRRDGGAEGQDVLRVAAQKENYGGAREPFVRTMLNNSAEPRPWTVEGLHT